MPKYPEDEHGSALARVAADGNDMSQPMDIDFSIDVPDEPAAKSVASAVSANGFTVAIDYDEGEPLEDGEEEGEDDEEDFEPSWTVTATRRMVPGYETVVAAESELTSVVGPLGGRVDGWGTGGHADEQETRKTRKPWWKFW